jgi:hypothetical protein
MSRGEDTDASAARVANLERDRRKLKLMEREGWKRAHENFSAELMARRTSEPYDRFLNRKV